MDINVGAQKKEEGWGWCRGSEELGWDGVNVGGYRNGVTQRFVLELRE